MRQKYLSKVVAIKNMVPKILDSSIWKSICHLICVIVQERQWLVKDGSINFWYEDWKGIGSLANKSFTIISASLKIKYICSSLDWNYTKLLSFGGCPLLCKVMKHPIKLKSREDCRVWKHTSYTSFIHNKVATPWKL